MPHCPGCGHPMSREVWGAHMFGCGFKGLREADHDTDRGEFMVKAYNKEFSKDRKHSNYATKENEDVLETALRSIWDKLKSNEIDRPKKAAPLLYAAIGQQLNPDWDRIQEL